MMPGRAVSTATTDRSELRESGGERVDKRARILEAAILVFARHGYHGARVSDIAREAGIAYGLVYHYFRNKEEILASVFEERWSGFLAVVEVIAAGPRTSTEKLEAIAAIILNAFRVKPDWVKVLVLEIQRSSRFSDPERIRAVGRLFEQVARILRAGQEAGELRRDVDPQVACFVFLGALDLAITSLVLGLTRIDGGDAQEIEYHARAARSVVDVFLRGVEERKG
jgi:TetR/AcrR family transcriptional regulator, fatty acid metabolism regulator protein